MLFWKDPSLRSSTKPSATIGLAGDFLPANGLMPDPGASWSSLAARVAPHFSDLHLTVANLECPVAVDGLTRRTKASLSDTFAAPAEALDYLRALNVRIVSLANNHSCDYGKAGLDRTRAATSAAGILPLGSGRSLSDSPEVHVWQGPDQLRVGIWCAARNLRESAAWRSPGLEPANMDRAKHALAAMRQLGANCCIAYLHAGSEHTNYPDPDDVAFINSLATRGFDVVAACHSHRVSGCKAIPREGKSPAFCFYGLGSLSSGILYSSLEQEGIVPVLTVNADGGIAAVEVRTIYLEPPGWASVPSPEYDQLILDRVILISDSIDSGAYRQRYHSDVSRNLLSTQWQDACAAFRQAGIPGLFSKARRVRGAHVAQLFRKGIASIGPHQRS